MFNLIARRDKCEKFSDSIKAIILIITTKMCDSRFFIMRVRSTQIIFRNFFVGYRLNYIRSRHKHIRSFIHHKNKISHGRRINGSTSTWTHDQRYLRNHTRGLNVAVKNLGVSGKSVHTFLDPRSPRVIYSNYWNFIGQSKIHDLTDFFCKSSTQGPTPASKIL